MKNLKITISITATLFMLFLFIEQANAQLEFVGNYDEGMGGAGWDADGSGPEPYGNGNGNIFYYTASRDYLDGEEYCGGKLTDVLNGFPMFEQALDANGYSRDQVTLKFALANLGDDVEGIDYFSVGGIQYCNFYPIVLTFELDGEPLVEAVGNYGIYITGTSVRELESGFLKINNISSPGNNEVANAFMADMGSEELQLKMTIGQENGPIFSSNGRLGAYIDVTCTFEKGLPEIPLKGEYDENEGFIGWDADGTGIEPEADGHDNMAYYTASVDYMDIIPDGNFSHFLDGQKGFLNTQLQLQYRGFEIGDLKLKLGLSSLGPDVEGEDYGAYWRNYYNNEIIFEINSEPILSVLLDTNLVTSGAGSTSVGLVYDISENVSAEAQYVALSLLKDLGTHQLKIIADYSYAANLTGDGRDGAFYNIPAGKIQGVHEKATFIPEGTVSGTWTLENSPYYIEGPIIIENNQTLTIEPGVRVATRGAYPVTVKGCVNAEGTASDNIMFTASNPNITWDGLNYEGNAIFSSNPSVFDHCIFQYGQGRGSGAYKSGGIFAIRDYDDIKIYNSVFRYNVADLNDMAFVTCGGAMALWNSSPFIQSCIFHNNYALDYAGAVLVYAGSEPVISNCLFYENESVKGGAIAFYQNGHGILTNSTIANNYSQQGGGLYFYDESDPEVINTILWGNVANTYGSQVFFSSIPSSPGFYYNDIEGGEEGFGGGPNFTGEYLFNIDEDPIFGEFEEFPFIISDASPCANLGTPNTSPLLYNQYLPEYCLCGFERNYGGRIDMGAYETDVSMISTDVHNPISNGPLTFYPNPATTQIMISTDQLINTEVTIEVINFVGQKILKENGLTGTDSKISIDISKLPSGAYVCKMTTSEKIYTGKLVKE
ncbi:T9SS type A sorting domain-containing protein [Desulfosarcina sp.]|nr:T9SS type A sorting domain-containing protein [Desulfosarcina sp.]